MWRVVLLLVVLGFVAPCAAYADDAPQKSAVADAKPATDGLLFEANRFGEKWWTDHENPLDCNDAVFTYNEPADNPNGSPLARGNLGDREKGTVNCGIFYENKFVADIRKLLATGIRSLKVHALIDLCAVTLHEQGHELGFVHEDTGIMEPHETEHPPGECFDWARSQAGPIKARISKRKLRNGRISGR